MSEPFSCEIVTPERSVFKDEAVFVVLPGMAGEMGIYRNHAPTVTTLKEGALKVQRPDESEVIFAVSGGYAEVDGTKVIVLANRASDLADEDSAVVKDRLAELQSQLDGLRDDYANSIPVQVEIKWNELLQHLLER